MPTLVVHCEKVLDRVLELSDRDLRVGRGEENDLVLSDPTKAVSRRHAELRKENGRYVLIDLNSPNGLWVRGRRERKIELELGVPVTIGKYTLSLAETPVLAVARPVAATPSIDTSDTLIPVAGEKVATNPVPAPQPELRQAKPTPPIAPHPVKRPSIKPNRASDLGVLAALSKPKNLLGGAAFFLFLILAFGLFFTRPSKPDGQAGGPITVSPPQPSNTELRDQHVTAAKAFLDQLDYDGALKELDAALLVMPGDQEVVDLRAKATDAKTLAAAATGPATTQGTTIPAGATLAAPTLVTNAPGVALTGVVRRPKVDPGPPLSIGCRPAEERADCAQRDREVTERYDRAKSAFDAGSFQAAITQLSEIARDEPNYRDVALLTAHAREGVRNAAQQALDTAAKAESGGDLAGALAQYQRAPQIDSSTAVVAEESGKRVRARMKTEGTDAFTRARQYDAVGRTADAVNLYDRAFRYLPDDDANKKTAKDRLDVLRPRQ